MIISLIPRGNVWITVATSSDFAIENDNSNCAVSWVFCAIIYHLATDGLASLARTASIYKDEKFSDHAPLTIGYNFSL